MKKKILHVGLTPPNDPDIFHCPFIEIVPKDLENIDIQRAFFYLPETTHFIFTSKTAVRIFSSMVDIQKYQDRECISVGQSTTRVLQEHGFHKIFTAKQEMAEGVVDLIRQEQKKHCFYFWGHADKARSLITDELDHLAIPYAECILYETRTLKPQILPNLDQFEEIVFTSPSSVHAFIENYGFLPRHKILTSYGPITKEKLELT